MAVLLGNQIASHRAKISSLFLISFPAEVSNPLLLFRTPWTWAMAKAYGLLVYRFIVLCPTPPPPPEQVLDSNLKAQLLELRFPCSNIVPR